MSDYTPTTQEVRNRYVFGTFWENDGDTSGGDNAPFNRWLTQNNTEVAATERDRFIALLDNELNQCTCEDPLRHLRERVLMIAVKGERENTERTLFADNFRTTTGQEARSGSNKGDVTERLQNEMSPNGYTEGKNK